MHSGSGPRLQSAPNEPDPEPQAVELEAEQEVDFGRYGRTIAARWRLLVVGAVIGALIGFLVRSRTGRSNKGTAQAYLGQPLAPDSAAAVTTSPTTLGLVQAFITSEEAIERLRPPRGCDRRGCATMSPSERFPGTSTTRQAFPAPLLDQVTGLAREDRRRRKPPGETGRRRGRPVHEDEDRTLEAQLAFIDTQLGIVSARLNAARASQEDIAADPTLSPRREARRPDDPQHRDHARRAAAVTLELNRFNTTNAVSLARDIEASRGPHRRWRCGRSRRAGGRACS